MKPEHVQTWMKALGGQRFLLTVGAGLVNTILVWYGKITSGDFVLVTGSTVAVFILGAAYQQRGQSGDSTDVRS